MTTDLIVRRSQDTTLVTRALRAGLARAAAARVQAGEKEILVCDPHGLSTELFAVTVESIHEGHAIVRNGSESYALFLGA